jgi:hypothetical protein
MEFLSDSALYNEFSRLANSKNQLELKTDFSHYHELLELLHNSDPKSLDYILGFECSRLLASNPEKLDENKLNLDFWNYLAERIWPHRTFLDFAELTGDDLTQNEAWRYTGSPVALIEHKFSSTSPLLLIYPHGGTLLDASLIPDPNNHDCDNFSRLVCNDLFSRRVAKEVHRNVAVSWVFNNISSAHSNPNLGIYWHAGASHGYSGRLEEKLEIEPKIRYEQAETYDQLTWYTRYVAPYFLAVFNSAHKIGKTVGALPVEIEIHTFPTQSKIPNQARLINQYGIKPENFKPISIINRYQLSELHSELSQKTRQSYIQVNNLLIDYLAQLINETGQICQILTDGDILYQTSPKQRTFQPHNQVYWALQQDLKPENWLFTRLPRIFIQLEFVDDPAIIQQALPKFIPALAKFNRTLTRIYKQKPKDEAQLRQLLK